MARKRKVVLDPCGNPLHTHRNGPPKNLTDDEVAIILEWVEESSRLHIAPQDLDDWNFVRYGCNFPNWDLYGKVI